MQKTNMFVMQYYNLAQAPKPSPALVKVEAAIFDPVETNILATQERKTIKIRPKETIRPRPKPLRQPLREKNTSYPLSLKRYIPVERNAKKEITQRQINKNKPAPTKTIFRQVNNARDRTLKPSEFLAFFYTYSTQAQYYPEKPWLVKNKKHSDDIALAFTFEPTKQNLQSFNLYCHIHFANRKKALIGNYWATNKSGETIKIESAPKDITPYIIRYLYTEGYLDKPDALYPNKFKAYVKQKKFLTSFRMLTPLEEGIATQLEKNNLVANLMYTGDEPAYEMNIKVSGFYYTLKVGYENKDHYEKHNQTGLTKPFYTPKITNIKIGNHNIITLRGGSLARSQIIKFCKKIVPLLARGKSSDLSLLKALGLWNDDEDKPKDEARYQGAIYLAQLG